MQKLLMLMAAALVMVAQASPFKPLWTHRRYGERLTGVAQMTRDGRLVYFARDSSALMMLDRKSGKETRLASAGRTDLHLSNAGDRLAYSQLDEAGGNSYIWTLPLDPSTGLASGSPRRVSMTRGVYPQFSPDGRQIAFASPTSADDDNIIVVPAVGGPEQVVARLRGRVWPIRWTPDGRELYFGLSFNDPPSQVRDGIYRVALAGGQPTFITPAANWGASPGLSPDGKRLLYFDPSWDSLVVATPDGKRIGAYGEFDVVGPDQWLDGNRVFGAQVRRPRRMSVFSVETGKTTLLTDSGEDNFWVRLSPDGRRTAILGPGRVTIVNVDGTARRTFKLRHPGSANPSVWWAPDGRSLLIQSSVRPFPLAIVDPESGHEEEIATKSSLTNPYWLSSGRGILYLAPVDTASRDSLRPIEIHERMIGGGDRVIRTLTLACPVGPCNAVFVDDSTLLIRDSGKYFLQPLRGGEARLIDDTGGMSQQPAPSISSDRKWIAIRHSVGAAAPRRIELIRTDGSARKSVALSFQTTPGGDNPHISADGRELIVTGGDPREGSITLYRVDVATGRATALTTIAKTDRPRGATLSVSNDGRFIAYPQAGPFVMTLQETDVSAAMKLVPPARNMTKGPFRSISIASVALTFIGLAAPVRAQVPPVRPLGAPIASTPRDSLMSAVIARVLSDGRVIANDSPRKRYVMFDSSLSTMRILLAANTDGAAYPVGGAAMYSYLGDTTVISDLAAVSFLMMDPSGKIARIAAHPRPSDIGVLHPVTGGVAFDAAGRMYYRGLAPAFPGPNGTLIRGDSAPIIRANVESRASDTIAWLRAPRPPSATSTVDADGVRHTQLTLVPFDLSDEWGMLSDGTIAIVRAGNFHVDWLAPDGTRSSSPPIKWSWVRLDDDRKNALLDSLARTSARADSIAMANFKVNNPGRGLIRQTVIPSRDEIPDYLPAFVPQAARPDRRAHLWIREYTGFGTARRGAVYSVLDRQGAIIDRLELPEGREISGFGADGSVYLTVKLGAGVVIERYRNPIAK